MSRSSQVAAALAGTSALLVSIAVTSHLADAGRGSKDRLVLRGGVPGSGSAVTASPSVNQQTPRTRPGSDAQPVFAAWANTTAAATGVPARALVAYAAVQHRLAREQPGCHLSWPTLAGIGYIESQNGGAGGGLLASGRPLTRILGISLDGSGSVAPVADTDNGRLDADPTLDKAVGPLQFLPSTWATWAADGDGDGIRDPQDIDDAALGAGRYLCVAGDLATADGWTRAILSYNHSIDYVDAVYDAAQTFAQRSDAG